MVNFFVPSGGGQWVVQGPLLLEAGAKLGVSPQRIIMALAYGDQWTNMLQPFWALALLGVTGLKARDIIGYTTLVMLLTAPIFILGLMLLPM
jgi:short-chain fatty acids transporter